MAAAILDMEQDSYSVSGQLLLHTRWFLFPLGVPALWAAHRFTAERWPRTARVLTCLGILVVAGVAAARPFVSDSTFWSQVRKAHRIELSEDEWEALQYLHDETPLEARILSARYAVYVPHDQSYASVYSGLGGRTAFLELPTYGIHARARELLSEDDRTRFILRLWNLSKRGDFCEALLSSPVDFIVEYKDRPLGLSRAGCLRKKWRSSNGYVTIWSVNRPETSE